MTQAEWPGGSDGPAEVFGAKPGMWGEARDGMFRDGAAGKAGERGNPGSKEG